MSASTHQIKVKGVDQTGAAFGSIRNRAAATGAQIRSMLGGAIAAAGAYLGFSAIKGGIDQLGHLSDVAMRTSTSVDELTKTSSALSALGISGMGVDQLAKAFDYMQKSTGRSGMQGFYQTIEELGKIEDTALRSEAAMKVFGRSGMAFMPLINAADQSVDALQTVVQAMPQIPQAAADAGDAMSDAMGFAANQMKSIWLQGLGAVCGWFDSEFTGGVREASLAAGNYLEYYTKVAVTKCITWFKKYQAAWGAIGQTAGTFFHSLSENGKWYDWLKLLNPASIAGDYAYKWITGKDTAMTQAISAAKEEFSAALDEYADEAERLDKIEEERLKRFNKGFEDRKIAIQKYNAASKAAATSTAAREKKAMSVDLGKSASAVRNELILAGNEANKLAALGPQMNESKKQTSILEQIAKNTADTADNTEKEAGEEPDVWDGN